MPAYPTLKNRSVTLAVTGGIAAYKSCELVRLLKKAGADVRVIMTEAAAHFVTPLTFEALSGHAVGIENLTRDMPHLAATHGACDLMIVAPAPADILGKAAHGIADNLVSTAIIARAAPLAVCPAMNTRMWENPAVQRSVIGLLPLRSRVHHARNTLFCAHGRRMRSFFQISCRNF